MPRPSWKTWTADELEELETKRRELGLWGDAMELWRYRQDEFLKLISESH